MYVACVCFRAGLTSEPPIPRELLDHDAYGNVKRKVDRNPEDSPGDLWEWRETACTHPDMRFSQCLWYKWGAVERESTIALPKKQHPTLRRILTRRAAESAATVHISYGEARTALAEMENLLAGLPPIQTRVLIAPDGRASAPLDGMGTDEVGVFKRIGSHSYPDGKISGVLELGIENDHFVVRDYGTSGYEAIRSRTLRIEQDTHAPALEIGRTRLYRTFFIPEDGHYPTWCWAPAYSFFPYNHSLDRRKPYVPDILRIERRTVPYLATDSTLDDLRSLLAASVSTGNPVVTYYNGSSLGFEQP
ncbi:hypothetical protein TSOC111612_12900 [Tsukamurella ocularis]